NRVGPVPRGNCRPAGRYRERLKSANLEARRAHSRGLSPLVGEVSNRDRLVRITKEQLHHGRILQPGRAFGGTGISDPPADLDPGFTRLPYQRLWRFNRGIEQNRAWLGLCDGYLRQRDLSLARE